MLECIVWGRYLPTYWPPGGETDLMTNTLVYSRLSTSPSYCRDGVIIITDLASCQAWLSPRRIYNWDIISLHTSQVTLSCAWPLLSLSDLMVRGWSNKKIWYYLVIFSIIVKHLKFISLSWNKLEKIFCFESNLGSVRLVDFITINQLCLVSALPEALAHIV